MPFDRAYYIDKIEEYNAVIKENQLGDFKIIKKDGINKPVEHYLFKADEECNNAILELSSSDGIIMSLSPLEIEGCFESIKRAKGKVGVVGLGLGYYVQEIIKKPQVKEVIVYEKSKEIIELYYKSFNENPKIRIINEDAFSVKGEEFDFFFVDIYSYELSLDVVSDYIRFNKLHNITEYSFWGLERFLLSCQMEDLVWVYIPEEWLSMVRDLYNKFEETKYFKNFKPMDENIVKEVLHAFSEVL
ncbi:hypothetical protein [Clostridium sp. 'White wine YQ']|uniref:hypothetical protein n=1 Tax=Clostridium sp. 'White wine YQ' TaxID=3027474 RepID=UPI002365EC70|nr:hypothetical protein [Clostridium sp. 'White wine YQ']MDD7794948.1 hypothetical protein [Clostridium sp. 'White wine YQ']